MTDIELKEFNDFTGANPIRNNFLPIMNHICKLTKDLDVYEFHNTGDKEENTSSIQFIIKNKNRTIDGRVCYDWTGKGKTNLFFELWWDDENYCCLYSPIQMMNMISVLMGRLKLEGDTYKQIRKSETLFPIIHDPI
jgi:hypothetical protein